MGIADVDLAAWLRRAREQSGLTEQEICQATKIHPKFIRALEAGQYSVLPSPTHVRAFALAFARVCGANEGETMVLVSQAMGRTPSPSPTALVNAKAAPTPAPVAPMVPQSPLRRAPAMQSVDEESSRWTLWAGMALGVAALLWVLTQLIPAPGARVVKNSLPKVSVAGNTQSKNVEVVQDRVSRSGIKPRAKDPVPTIQPVSASEMAEEVLPLVSNAASGTGDQALTLRSRRDCWVVVQMDGKRLPVVILAADEKKVFYFKDKLVLLAGNAGAIKVWWDGKSIGWLGDLGKRENGVVFEKGQAMRRDETQSLDLPAGIEAIQAGIPSGED